jgi:uncharacterized protein
MARPEDSRWAIAVGQVSTRPGQSDIVSRTFPAPSGIGDEVVGVTEGDDVTVNGSIDSITDGLVFAGTVNAPVHAECTRCLIPVNRSWDMPFTAFFPYDFTAASAKYGVDGEGNDKRNGHAKDEETEILAEEDESEDIYPFVEGGAFIDIEALLRDTMVEGLPLQVLCRPDCKGLCSQCGANLNDNPDHHHEVTDDRFAALAGLKKQLEREQH